MRKGLTVLVGLALAFGGCGGDDGDGETAGEGAPPASSTSTTAGTAGGEEAAGLDLATGGRADLGGGWTVTPCESGPPLFCIDHDGDRRGVLEHLQYPVASIPEVQRVLTSGGSVDEALRRQAADFSASFVADRRDGCGADYTVEPIGPRPLTVAGHRGASFGFDGRLRGVHVERALQLATIVDGTLHVLGTNAQAPGSCMDDADLVELTVEDLVALQPALERMVAASSLG